MPIANDRAARSDLVAKSIVLATSSSGSDLDLVARSTDLATNLPYQKHNRQAGETFSTFFRARDRDTPKNCRAQCADSELVLVSFSTLAFVLLLD